MIITHTYAVRSVLRCIIAGLVVLIGMSEGAAGESIDHRGREFWVTFMPNLGSNPSESSHLRLYLLSEGATRTTITYMFSGVTKEVLIPSGASVAVVDVNELFGDTSELGDFTIGNGVTEKSFVVLADADITVVGVNIRDRSADAFLALPADALGQHYYVLAYPNGWDMNLGRSDTPSEFAVVATEDGTRLNVTRPTGVKINGRSEPTFTVILNRGEVFLGQAQLLPDADVSGTEIAADRPVAVFAGTKRAANPGHIGNYRDHMVEQIAPDKFWKTTAIAAPRAPHADRADSILYRIIARDPATISIFRGDDFQDVQLPRRGIDSFTSVAPVRIISDAPILVAQYDPSQMPRMGSPISPGDPSMSIVPSPEQWDTAYTFISIPDPHFAVHFVDVIVPHTATVTMDGSIVDAARRSIDGTLDYFHLQVGSGRHHVSATAPIGVAVYGAAEAISYAYPAGFIFGESASVPDEPAGYRLLAMPNPVSGDYLDLEFPAIHPALLHMEIIDERGVRMPAIPGQPDVSGEVTRVRVDVSALCAGTYFCRVSGGGGRYYVAKFLRR